MSDPSPQSRHQGRALLARNEARNKPPQWVTDPRTGIERQAAGLLAGRPDDGADEPHETSSELRRVRRENRDLNRQLRDLRKRQ